MHPGQFPEEVANQVAASYGCELLSVKPENVAQLLRDNLKQCLGFVEAWQCHLSDGGHTKAAATVEEVLISARDAYRLSSNSEVMNIQFEIKSNNASVKSICPVCRVAFKPSLGDWAFKAGTWDPLCEDCWHQAQVDSCQRIQTSDFK